MRRVAIAVISTVTALVLLLSFKTHTASSVASPSAAVSTPSAGSTSSVGSGSSSNSSAKSTKKKSSTTSTSTTVTGDAVDTQYGPVQVRITVKDGKITSATAVEYPTTQPRDQQINAYAIPALNQEAVSAGTASIDMISGATFTSEGYIESLQSALDKAKSG